MSPTYSHPGTRHTEITVDKGGGEGGSEKKEPESVVRFSQRGKAVEQTGLHVLVTNEVSCTGLVLS